MVVFTFVFGKLAKMPTEGNAPYPILVFAGMLPWTLFSSALGEASNSLIGNSNLISKVYFPRLIIPSASIITSFIDFLLSFTMMILIMAYYNYSPTWRVLLLPFFTIWALLTSFGPGLFVTSLNVKYRDFRYVIPFIVQFGLYISPVGFSSQVIPEKWKLLYSFNPMVSVIDGFRWCLIGGQTKIYPPAIIAGILSCCFFLWLGISQFRKMEKSFADLI
jgi:lipopolysaccharide transport system permease protein